MELVPPGKTAEIQGVRGRHQRKERRIRMATIGFIGMGNMGKALLTGLLKEFPVEELVFTAKTDETRRRVYAETQVTYTQSNAECANSCKYVILAVKPQVLPTLYESLKEVDTGLWISIAAGVPLSVLEDHIGTENVVRFMPNIAAASRKSVTAIAAGSEVSTEQKDLALSIASSFGSAYFIQENLFPAFIGISGSGIAFFFEMMHQMAMAGVKEGIPYPEALSIVRDTALSAAEIARKTGKNAIELETMVCSAAGTTIEGVKALQDGGFASTVINAVESAASKSVELETKARYGER